MQAVATGSVGLFGLGFGFLRSNSTQSRRDRADVVAERVATPAVEAAQPASHGLTEAQLRELIAQDLRAFVRRPLARPAGATREQPFLLDRLMGAGA